MLKKKFLNHDMMMLVLVIQLILQYIYNVLWLKISVNNWLQNS